MAITETIEKRQLVVDLGKNEVPSAWRWRVVKFIRYDDGTDVVPPQSVEVDADPAEVAAHIGAAVVAQAADIAADRVERDAIRADLAAERAAKAAAEGELVSTRDALARKDAEISQKNAELAAKEAEFAAALAEKGP